jgi:YggT family protein
VFVFGDLIIAISKILNSLLELYKWVIIISALLSWVNPDPYNPIVRFLYQITEPVLYRVRRYIGSMGGIDLSPLVVILVIIFLQQSVVRILFKTGMSLGGG